MPSDFRVYRGAMKSLRGARETSARAFYAGVLRHRVLHKRAIWVGSDTVLDGVERIEIAWVSALRVGRGYFRRARAPATTAVRARPGRPVRRPRTL